MLSSLSLFPADPGTPGHARGEELLTKRQKWDASPHLASIRFPEDGCRMGVPAKAPPTLFDWQIWQEEGRFGGLCPDALNSQDEDGDTILHIAVAKGKRAAAHVLAAKMARCGSLDLKERHGQTALHIAAAVDQHLIVRDLVGHGARLDARDLWGRSPLHLCAEKGHALSLQSIWRSLTGSGLQMDVDMLNYDGLTPLHVAVLCHNGVLKELRRPEAPCAWRRAELLQRRQVYVDCVKTLLLMGASLGTREVKSGRTCLHMASEEANVELLRLFLEQPSARSSINAKMLNGNTALHVVSSLRSHKRQAEAARVLMSGGADPGARNLESEVPSQLVPGGAVGREVRQVLEGPNVVTLV